MADPNDPIPDRAYLDWNATAPLRKEARAAMQAALHDTGNPSSVHREGRSARRLIEDARASVARLVGAEPREVVFTSGCTEANMLALTPTLDVTGGGAAHGRLLVSSIEHLSVRAGGRFAPAAIDEIAVDGDGALNLGALQQQLTSLATSAAKPLVSIMLANNETGVVQPVPAAAAAVHATGGLLHVDAAQGPGKITCDFKSLGADLLTISAHKMGGPAGVGALIRRADLRLDPLIKGGGQERNQRAGTENMLGIVGFGAAAEAARIGLAVEAANMCRLRDMLEDGIRRVTPDAVIFGSPAERLPNTTLFAIPGTKAETVVIAFDLAGVAVSSGAACSSGKVSPSHVLAAMGVPRELSQGAIRVSLGYSTTEQEVAAFLGAWAKLATALYKGREIAA